MIRTVVVLGIAWCGIALYSPIAYGWDSIAHYEIAKGKVGSDGARFASMPDYWESKQSSYLVYYQVTDHFCWSHAVQDAGHVYGDTCPVTPFYLRDSRHPEWDNSAVTPYIFLDGGPAAGAAAGEPKAKGEGIGMVSPDYQE